MQLFNGYIQTGTQSLTSIRDPFDTRLNKSAYFISFELDPKWSWLLETNPMSDWAIVTQRGKC